MYIQADGMYESVLCTYVLRTVPTEVFPIDIESSVNVSLVSDNLMAISYL